ncbi:MAG: translation initiation factor IF-6 [Methanoregulaceae archaeon]
MDRTTSFAGDPHIGVFSRVFDDIAIIPREAPEEFIQAVREQLEVEIILTNIQGSAIVGSLVAGNNKGIVISGLAQESEIAAVSEYRDVMLLSRTMNAAGNVILANDNFAAVHPEMPEGVIEELSEFLGVPVIPLTLGGIRTVGMAGVASNRGVIVHPRAHPQEIAQIEELTDLPVGTGSINMGSGLLGTGLVANKNGYLAGIATSGFELGRIEDVFGFLE